MPASNRARKREALARMRQGKGGRLDDTDDEEDDDVYDVVEESEYQNLVNRRRQQEDFVVDDDGLGYHDDGEERLGDEANADDSKPKSRNANSSLTAKALKKARKQQRQKASAEDDAKPKTMWSFVNQAGHASASAKPTKIKTSANVDALLSTLDEAPVRKRKAKASVGSSRASRRARMSRRPPAVSRTAVRAPEEDYMDHEDDNDVVMDDDQDFGDSAESPASPAAEDDSHEAGEERHSDIKDSADKDTATKDTEEDSAEVPAPRRRVASRPKLGQVSRAIQKQQEKKEEEPKQKEAEAPMVDATAASFSPQMLPADETPLPTTNKFTLDQVVQKSQDDDGKTYVDMFWTDLCEQRNGDILVFGKVQTAPNKYASACLLVQGTVRNVFVLPREGASMMDVHQEVNDILQKHVLSRGASWAGKKVKRAYAFGDASIPREATEYLKVVYSAKHDALPSDICESGGESFSKILNAGASKTETFIVKRGLKGPGWIRISQPQPTPHSISWCSLEVRIDAPKQVKPLKQAPPPPPLVTVSLKIKTMTNPTTHASEIVCISARGQDNFQLESNIRGRIRQMSLVRPVSVTGQGAAVFPRDLPTEVAAQFPNLQTQPNERALLSCFLATMSQWDPDVWMGHSAWNYEMDVILARCAALKIATAWSKLGRRRRTGLPAKGSNRDWVIQDSLAGRLLCDTFLSSKELLRETTYSLSNLSMKLLNRRRQEIEPSEVPQWFGNSKTIVQLAKSTLFDTELVEGLAFKLQILPLTKQLTNIAGNLWSQTLKSNRAVRTEYLLLHEFHGGKFLPPEKQKKAVQTNKAKYAGGLVLEPKKGLYDSFILLLDFNSLYPSIIQEYNLCFTTVNWAPFQAMEDGGQLPQVPDPEIEAGFLPRVIKSLVERRRNVKKLLKSEANPEKKEEVRVSVKFSSSDHQLTNFLDYLQLDIRQKALKLTANSMYGCLGFSNSRFYAQPIAAMVTSMGRETLQRTVDLAQQKVGLDVIYGDTDSIMINTRLNSEDDLPKVRELGDRVKREVNKLYKTLELEIDGIFRTMLLLKKKKYAAKTVEFGPNGQISYGEELKGLDLVRRDWCIQSKESGRYVTEQILSGNDNELVVSNILVHMEELAKKMRSGELPLDKYTITKGLSKHPNEYPDAKSQPHVQVAKRMLQNNKAVNHGDHIPYIITQDPPSQEGDTPKASSSYADRARHPDEIVRSDGKLKPDVEWYLTQQILPPIVRLCDPIEGASQQILAEKLGLDAAKYNQSIRVNGDFDADDLIDYTPASTLSDAERFKDVEKFHVCCYSCGVESEFPGVFRVQTDVATGTQTVVSGLTCTNPDCANPRNWGHASHFEFFARVSNNLNMYSRNLGTTYYKHVTRCDEPGCGLETRQLSVAGGLCLRRGCNGKMAPIVTERAVYTHLKYLESLFSLDHASGQLVKKKLYGTKKDILSSISKHDKATFEELHSNAKEIMAQCAFNWISPSCWGQLFPSGKCPVVKQ